MKASRETEPHAASGGLWVIGEQRNNTLTAVSLELLGGAQALAHQLKRNLAAVILGHDIADLAEELVAYGADTVYVADAPQLRLYQSDIYARIIADLIRDQTPNIVLWGATTIGRDLAPRVAAKLHTGLTADCVELSLDDDSRLVQTVPGYGGNMMVNCLCPQQRPQMATVRPGVLRKLAKSGSRHGQIVHVPIRIDERECKAKTIKVVEQKAETSLEGADIIVAGGWGLRSADDFRLLEQLSQVLGGAIGGTRPLVDKGWISEEQMIGQSGKTVRPRLYIGVGISGAMHHLVGIKDSEVIIAINNDRQAPIFNASDVGILGDLKKVLPRLIAQLQIKAHSA
jgi:electron transfer flavoprotein alpha subunit